MGFRIQNNLASINAHRYLSINDGSLNKTLERLSSGYRINSASDDAAGLAASMRMRMEIASLKVASRNATEASSALQVAEGAMSEIGTILERLKELATQAASGNASGDRSKIDVERGQLVQELDRIVNFTKYGDDTLLDGSFGGAELDETNTTAYVAGVTRLDVTNGKVSETYTIDVGDLDGDGDANDISLTDSNGNTQSILDVAAPATDLAMNETKQLNFDKLGVVITYNNLLDIANASAIDTTVIRTTATPAKATYQVGDKNTATNQISFSIGSMSAADLFATGGGLIDFTTVGAAQTALGVLDDAVSKLATARADLGALLNRFSYTSSNLATSIENKTASESVIRDVDMAAEMSNFTKYQILVQAGTAMLAQANQAPQNILSLLK